MDEKQCIAAFPCVCDIFVLAGLYAACEACAPQMDAMRAMSGYVKHDGYFKTTLITAEQQRMIDDEIQIRKAKK